MIQPMSAVTANILISLILVIIVAGAVLYIYREKKNGRHCIGCPMAGNCSKHTKGCNGS